MGPDARPVGKQPPQERGPALRETLRAEGTARRAAKGRKAVPRPPRWPPSACPLHRAPAATAPDCRPSLAATASCVRSPGGAPSGAASPTVELTRKVPLDLLASFRLQPLAPCPRRSAAGCRAPPAARPSVPATGAAPSNIAVHPHGLQLAQHFVAVMPLSPTTSLTPSRSTSASQN